MSEMRCLPWCVNICSMLNEELHDQVVPTRTCGMQWQDTVKDRVDGLAVRERILDETDIASGSGRVQAKMWD